VISHVKSENDIVEIFNVFDLSMLQHCECLSDVPAPSDSSKEISTVVTGLNPYTQYQFRVVGVNVLGEGVPSKPSSKSFAVCLAFFYNLLV